MPWVLLFNYIISIVFATTAFFLNGFLLLSIFYYKKITVNPSMTFIYWKFGADLFYTLSLSICISYYLLMSLSANFIIKNLTFWLVWASTSIGSMRSILALSISIERVFATFIPVYFHKYRSKFPNLLVLCIILAKGFLDQYILFGFCGNDIDAPLECNGIFCAVNSCYNSFYFSSELGVYFVNGAFSATLFFRFFIWNYFSKMQKNCIISRATRIALLDFFILLFFNVLSSHFVNNLRIVNIREVGPLTVATKMFGFVIEGLITCRVLFGGKLVSTFVATSNSLKLI
ncbi:Serpentine Receptor, class BC (Class B-like) [Caenorhabditis elegans]|uniref:Serpentine Receptor, class BC (Class B-like) n=1 Tax=Caenorhabditis elegans TaxID=6239 RepID=O17958_CAEEL|nr:Serpentine Receptor, class BC (Class B-like) [Caenorhabditis elegans]CAB05562.1 Serpentine Receptor, class BC (Class B-like) [Caenorhabditis elegans]|eukprot:NP_506774.1 Serpentine Receptor, class BC (class B-like) [Caenorhabditis elegans]